MTLEGIKILEDLSDKFGTVVRNFNNGRSKSAKDHIKNKRTNLNQDSNTGDEKTTTFDEDIDSDDIAFLQYTVQILKEDYNLDSAGIYEYLKEVVDTKIGARFRKKVWKEVETDPGTGTRYTRCLIVTINDVPYIVDVTKNNPSEIFHQFDEKELETQDPRVIPFKEMTRDWNEDPYDGR